jgi:hypothetical protein
MPYPAIILQSRVVNVLMGIYFIGLGVYTFLRREHGAKVGARFHERVERRLPWLYWPLPKGLASSPSLWRVLTPAMSIFFIIAGVLSIFVLPAPSN